MTFTKFRGRLQTYKNRKIIGGKINFFGQKTQFSELFQKTYRFPNSDQNQKSSKSQKFKFSFTGKN